LVLLAHERLAEWPAVLARFTLGWPFPALVRLAT
jgi:hypothetical protein